MWSGFSPLQKMGKTENTESLHPFLYLNNTAGSPSTPLFLLTKMSLILTTLFTKHHLVVHFPTVKQEKVNATLHLLHFSPANYAQSLQYLQVDCACSLCTRPSVSAIVTPLSGSIHRFRVASLWRLITTTDSIHLNLPRGMTENIFVQTQLTSSCLKCTFPFLSACVFLFNNYFFRRLILSCNVDIFLLLFHTGFFLSYLTLFVFQ